MRCPKCSYVRGSREATPIYECPKCNVIYAKYNPFTQAAASSTLVAPEILAPAENVAGAGQGLLGFLRTRIGKWTLSFAAIGFAYAAANWIGGWAFLSIYALPLALYLLKPQREAATTTECPACGGKVAWGVNSCPHCGRSKPASRAVSKGTVIATWLATGAFLVLLAQSPPSSTPERTKVDDELRRSAQLAVRMAGYRCDVVDVMQQLLIKTGFKLQCDGYRYAYTITDEGGRLVVRLD